MVLARGIVTPKTKTAKKKVVTMNLRIPTVLYRRLARVAEADRRSMHTCILMALEAWLERRKKA